MRGTLRRGGWLALLALGGCLRAGAFDLAPRYDPEAVVVPAAWSGTSPFVEAKPADAAVRPNWWTQFGDTALDGLMGRAMAESPDLQAAAERVLQARDEMMKARGRFVPHLGTGAEASRLHQSQDAAFRAPGEPDDDSDVKLGGEATWELDLFGRLRSRARQELHHAQEAAADYALARLSLQADLAVAYFTLRSIDAQDAIYRQSIGYYQESLDLVTLKFNGLIAADLDVARAQYQLASTQARHLGIQAQRQVTEHAIAVLVNAVPATFRIAAREQQADVALTVPPQLPSTLLQRRPDVAAAERRMAAANRGIGVARGAFFPRVPLSAEGGIAGHFAGLFKVPNFFWSLGAFLRLPVFDGGHRRAELQRAWSVWREAEHRYRATVLDAFREVEDGMSLTHFATLELERQLQAVEAATRQQSLSMELYKGGLASSLELISAQVNTLEARLMATSVRANQACAVVGLVRALGGGFGHQDLPDDDAVQPFGILPFTSLEAAVPTPDPSARDLSRQASF